MIRKILLEARVKRGGDAKGFRREDDAMWTDVLTVVLKAMLKDKKNKFFAKGKTRTYVCNELVVKIPSATSKSIYKAYTGKDPRSTDFEDWLLGFSADNPDDQTLWKYKTKLTLLDHDVTFKLDEGDFTLIFNDILNSEGKPMTMTWYAFMLLGDTWEIITEPKIKNFDSTEDRLIFADFFGKSAAAATVPADGNVLAALPPKALDWGRPGVGKRKWCRYSDAPTEFDNKLRDYLFELFFSNPQKYINKRTGRPDPLGDNGMFHDDPEAWEKVVKEFNLTVSQYSSKSIYWLDSCKEIVEQSGFLTEETRGYGDNKEIVYRAHVMSIICEMIKKTCDKLYK